VRFFPGARLAPSPGLRGRVTVVLWLAQWLNPVFFLAVVLAELIFGLVVLTACVELRCWLRRRPGAEAGPFAAGAP